MYVDEFSFGESLKVLGILETDDYIYLWCLIVFNVHVEYIIFKV